jgi:hypothetical protein
MVCFMDLVRYIILEHTALNMCSSQYLKGMPSYLTHTQKVSDSLLKIPQTVGHEGFTLLAPSPTVCVPNHGIVNKSAGKEITNKKQRDHRICQRQSVIPCISNQRLYSITEVASWKRSQLETLNYSLFNNGSKGFLWWFKPSIDVIPNLVSSARGLMDF